MADFSYSFAPSVVMVTDGDHDRGAVQAQVEAAGGRLRDIVPLGGGRHWIDEHAPVEAVLLAIGSDGGEMLDALLDQLDRDMALGRHAVVVLLPAALIDIAAARLRHQAAILLVDAGPAEIGAALAEALAQAALPPRLYERDGDPARLRQLSEEVGRIARTLAALSAPAIVEPAAAYRVPPQPDDGGDVEDFAVSAAMVRSVIRGRRLRDQFFESRLFADPAWDMLLDLAAARIEGRRVAVSSLCIAAAVPATTALRWIKTLVDEGLFVRVADPRDGRRVFIELSDAAADGVRAYFRALARAGIAAA